MATHPPDWHLFRAFLAVVREGSLSSAARVLGMTQPTMGRQVAALEASLGVKLFTRSLDGLSPTEAGMHALIGYDRDQAYARLLERMGLPFTRDTFAFRSDGDLAQLAALRAGFGIGASQLGIARRERNLVPVLHAALIIPMECWLVMHRDLRSSRRIRLLFDHLATPLSTYAQSSRFEK